MNWGALGAIGEIVGAGAVLVTLIYLAVQVRHLKKQTESATLNQIIDSLNNYAGQIAVSDTLATIIARGRSSYSALADDEKLRFDNIHYYLLNNLENWYLQYRELYGVSPEVSLANIESNIETFCKNPGFIEFWQHTEALYPSLAPIVEKVLRGDSESGN